MHSAALLSPSTDADLVVPFKQQQGQTCWLYAATMLRAYFTLPTFANPALKGFGEKGLDIHAEGRFDEYLRTYKIAIRENDIASKAVLAGILLKSGPVWAMDSSGTHCVVITGTLNSKGVDWVKYNDSARADGAGLLMPFAEFQKYIIIGIYKPDAFATTPDTDGHGAWV